MQITFHGAAREVTGSCHLLEYRGRRVLLDCGLIQGGRESQQRNREPFPFDPTAIDAVVLSHAHIDHSGRLPLLTRNGFRGPIHCTEATAGLCRVLLLDSARIHEEDARWKIKRLKKEGQDWNWVEPLYTEEDAGQTLGLLEPTPFDAWQSIGDGMEVRFVKAGHILGAAIVEVRVDHEGGKRLVFSGDLGVDGSRLLSAPHHVERPDYLLIESTYGNRDRTEVEDRTELLYQVIDRTFSRGGKVIIPSFAVGRTQELLARLNDLVENGRLDGLPVFVDSPMAVAATAVFAEHPEAYSADARRLLRSDEPLEFPGLRLIQSVDESKELNESDEPSVIISASGMCTAGRIKHHLAHNIEDGRHTILFVGYQARGTRGDAIKSGKSPIRIFGDWFEVGAHVESIDGFSAHADREELLAWYEGLGGNPGRTFIVHGEEEAALAFGETLRDKYGATVDVPKLGQTFSL